MLNRMQSRSKGKAVALIVKSGINIGLRVEPYILTGVAGVHPAARSRVTQVIENTAVVPTPPSSGMLANDWSRRKIAKPCRAEIKAHHPHG
jgi:hypothetical protein